MRIIRTILTLGILLLFSWNLRAQIPMKELDEIPWEKIEITQSDSLLNNLFQMNPDLRNKNNDLMDLQRDYSHIVNLNNDQYPDLIVYWTALLNENMLEIYLNTGNELKRLIRRPGRITFFEKHSPLSPLRINLKTYQYSSPPFLAEYTELTFIPEQDDIIIENIDFYDNTRFPDQLSINIPFVVAQSKYRLRRTPIIDNGQLKAPNEAGNIIQELTTGDLGIALAEETDETGRVWWFVMMQNNIAKSADNYFFINTDEPDRIKNPVFGWISSRYEKKL